MTRKNCDPKEFMLFILNEHLKFIDRLKRRKIPNKYYPLVDKEKEKTKQHIELITKILPSIIKKPLENDNRKLEKKQKKDNLIQRKDNEIQRKDDLIQKKVNKIEDLHKIIVKKDNQILILEEQMNNLQAEYKEYEGEEDEDEEDEGEDKGEEDEGEETKVKKIKMRKMKMNENGGEIEWKLMVFDQCVIFLI
ncbi:hypothetical protein C2G38_2213487 [Gigaspora rosea]|uniref:Uncharacterized protein n=1 Tax=Gigaspora rosea TaxID=44941 RepID=A0A397UC23_9GLOM|nr:hypothetical protein C2G38_2213487 [Gigaspora rosea]